jgi:hypothetical protein
LGKALNTQNFRSLRHESDLSRLDQDGTGKAPGKPLGAALGRHPALYTADEQLKYFKRNLGPVVNNHADAVAVDHIDLITGEISSLKVPRTSHYKHGESDSTTRVIARFHCWQVDAEGYSVIAYRAEVMTKTMYFRLRGTNLGLVVRNQSDADGNPLCDDLMAENREAKAWADL